MNALFASWIAFCARHRAGVALVLAALGLLAAGLTAGRGRFSNDVKKLFPDTPEVAATFRILHEARLADAVQLEFVARDDVTGYADFLSGAAERLRKLPDLTGVAFRCRAADPAEDLAAFSRLTPRFFSPDILRRCDPDAAARQALKLLAFPVPGQGKLLRLQPFGWERELLGQLKKIDDALGMKLDAGLPYFASPDRRRAMIAAEARIRIGDADAVRRLFAGIRSAVGALPPGLEMRIVSGCSHTLGNEEVLKRDAAIAGTVSLGLLLLLFLRFCRGDRRALWIPLLPLYASLLSLGAMTLIFHEICWYVIGLGGCVTGLAVDQGIHVYAACRGAEGERRTAALGLPMMLAAATSVAVFGLLALTGIEAYVQLAVFAGLSLVLSAFLALLVLPLLIGRGHELRIVLPAPPETKRRGWSLAAWGLVLAGLAVLPFVLDRADFALDSLDGTPENVLRIEREFAENWRRPGPSAAVLATSGADGEAALEHLRKLAGELAERAVAVAVPPRPSRREQEANRVAWRTPEVARRIAELAGECRAACRRNNLPENFFQPCFERLSEAVAAGDLTLPPLLELIDGRMIRSDAGVGTARGLLLDTPENVRLVRDTLRRSGKGRAALLSREGFRLLVREELGGRFAFLLPFSILAVVTLMFLVFRRIGDVLLALSPVACSLAGVLLLAFFTGFRLTPAAAFAMVLLTGLAADYGIYAVAQLRRPAELDTAAPIVLSAATTAAGAGALLFSHHPALFGTGAVLAPGIALACWCGVWLVPRLGRAAPRGTAVLLAGCAVLLTAGCAQTVPRQDLPDAEAVRAEMRFYPEKPFKLQAAAVVSDGESERRFLLAVSVDPERGAVTLAAVDPGSGALLFRCGAGLSAPVFGPAFGDAAPVPLRRLAERLPEDLARILVLKSDIPLAVKGNAEYITSCSGRRVVWRRDGEEAWTRTGGTWFGRWSCVCREAGRRADYRCGNFRLALDIGKIMTD